VSGVVELTITGPGKNALGSAVMEDLLARLEAAAGRPVLLTGAGDAFSAGLNLKEVAALDPRAMERFLDLLERLVEALYTYPAPTVACVNGHAIAGGCVLTLCCDHRIAADDPAIRIGLNEVALGLPFPPRLFTVVRRRVAPRALERVLLEAGLYPPRTALELGLVDAVAADAARAAREHLERLAAHPRDVYAATKRALRGTALELSADERRRFRDELVPAWCAPAVKERVRAVLGRGR
jgi:enoyl-CoA hydratase/carnithine racemase